MGTVPVAFHSVMQQEPSPLHLVPIAFKKTAPDIGAVFTVISNLPVKPHRLFYYYFFQAGYLPAVLP
jgi:hypothetical protein